QLGSGSVSARAVQLLPGVRRLLFPFPWGLRDQAARCFGFFVIGSKAVGSRLTWACQSAPDPFAPTGATAVMGPCAPAPAGDCRGGTKRPPPGGSLHRAADAPLLRYCYGGAAIAGRGSLPHMARESMSQPCSAAAGWAADIDIRPPSAWSAWPLPSN